MQRVESIDWKKGELKDKTAEGRAFDDVNHETGNEQVGQRRGKGLLRQSEERREEDRAKGANAIELLRWKLTMNTDDVNED